MRRIARALSLGPLFLLLLLLPALASSAGTCTTNEQCGKDELCSKLFDSCSEAGKCEPKPQDCTEHGHMIVKPVCGCDGKSYDNFCLAAMAGASVRHEGKCEP